MVEQTQAFTLPPTLRKWAVAYMSHRHAVLFYSLLLTMVSAPLFATLEFGNLGLKLVMASNLMTGVFGLRRGRGRTALLLVTIAALGAQAVPPALLATGVPLASFVFWSVIALFTAASAARYVIRAAVVRSEHVYAALSVYLLAGIFFGLLHWTIEQNWPGSYAMANGRELQLFEGIYFSFVTLATVGYGDVVPVSSVARGLAMLEAISGQLYLAVMIARLVGSHLMDRNGSARG